MFIDANDFIFISEIKFRKELIMVVRESRASKVALYVDDIIFLRKVAYKDVVEYDSLDYIISLGRGKDLDYSIVLNKPQSIPTLFKEKADWVSFRWDELKEYSDWTFPLGVGAYLYDRVELLMIINELNFKAPNSLEIAMQRYQNYFSNRIGLCK